MKRTRIAGDQETTAEGSGGPEPAQPHNSTSEQPTRREREGRSRWEKWVAIASLTFDFIIAICAVVGGFYIARQLEFMREDNLMTRESNEAASKESAATLGAMSDIADVMRDALSESRRQADTALEQSRLDSEANLELARESLEESRQVFEATQRARLVVDRFEFDFMAAPQQPFAWIESATAYIKNTGLMPATDVRWGSFLGMEETSRHAEAKLAQLPLGRDRQFLPLTVVGPGTEVEIRPYSRRPGEMRIDPPPIACAVGACFFYGRIKYLDGFGNDRTLDFCQYIHPAESHTWRPCFYANNAD